MLRCWAALPRKRPPFSELHNDLWVLKRVTLTTASDADVVLDADGTLRSRAGGQRWGAPDEPKPATGGVADEANDPDADIYEWPDEGDAGRRRPADYVSHALLRMIADGTATEAQAAAARRPARLSRDKVRLERKIGSGQFGEVWAGAVNAGKGSQAADAWLPVAVKRLTPQATEDDARDLIDEAVLMAQVSRSFRLFTHTFTRQSSHMPRVPLRFDVQVGDHANIVELLGLVRGGVGRGMSPLLVITMCKHGSLLSFLQVRSSRPSPAVSDRVFRVYGVCILPCPCARLRW